MQDRSASEAVSAHVTTVSNAIVGDSTPVLLMSTFNMDQLPDS
jgi:hypothetical protein